MKWIFTLAFSLRPFGWYIYYHLLIRRESCARKMVMIVWHDKTLGIRLIPILALIHVGGKFFMSIHFFVCLPLLSLLLLLSWARRLICSNKLLLTTMMIRISYDVRLERDLMMIWLIVRAVFFFVAACVLLKDVMIVKMRWDETCYHRTRLKILVHKTPFFIA